MISSEVSKLHNNKNKHKVKASKKVSSSIFTLWNNLFLPYGSYIIFVLVDRKWLWAFPQIEGVPPTPRGGHSATLTGASLVIFGGHFYEGKDAGFKYLSDTHVLDVNSSRWIKPKISGTPP